MATLLTAANDPKTRRESDRGLDVLDQMYEYYTREPRTPRVVSELDSRQAA